MFFTVSIHNGDLTDIICTAVNKVTRGQAIGAQKCGGGGIVNHCLCGYLHMKILVYYKTFQT